MDIERSITIHAPAEHVWDILATRFHEVGSWASMIDTSDALGVTSGPAGVADRVCNTPQGVFKEKVTHFDAQARSFAYQAYEGLPGFVREGGNTWWVEELGGGQTKVSFRMRFDLRPVANVLMGWMLQRNMGRLADDVAADLKAYAETGRVSEAKTKAIAKHGRKAA